MIRILLTYILPLILPAVLYVLWVSVSRKFGSSPERQLRDGPWFWIIIMGFALMSGALVTWGVTDGEAPGGKYEAPRFEDGRVVPGQVTPKDQ